MSKKNSILLFFVIILLTVVFTPFVGDLYAKYFGPVSGGFFWVSSNVNLEGFIISFLFFGSLLPWIFIKQNKIKYWLFYTLPLLVFMLLLGAFEELIIGFGVVALGWLLAQGVLLLKKIK